MVYFRLCNVTNEHKVLERVTRKSRFDELCRVFNNGNDDEIRNLGKKYKIFGAGIEADERQLTVKACDFINDYYNEKTALNATLSYPRYTEWLIHSVPFNLPVACGFTRERYNSSSTPSSYNCLATSHVASLYVTYFIDSCILTLIVISNIVILTVTWNTKSMHTAHGLFRSSLASADLIIAIVVG
uniref:G-protein coupled receptors family 1 profile domain-containing protein n=2 Tax=Ciona intestinalis TaxID=7719 RepID=F7ABI9_CIOIN